jgi:hypothetical protein
MNRMHSTIILIFVCVKLFSQTIYIDKVKLEYTKSRETLSIDFSNNQNANFGIPFSTEGSLKSISVNNYNSNNNSIIKNLEEFKDVSFWFNRGDFNKFLTNNKLFTNIKKIGIWQDRTNPKDTLSFPKSIELYSNLRSLSIGCCNPISIDNIDFSKLQKLDTLILEGPLFESNSFKNFNHISYIGLWEDSQDSISGFNTKKVNSEIKKYLPNTKFENWCFTKESKIRLFNGNSIFIKQLKLTDTVAAFDYIENKIVPTKIVFIHKHQARKYQLLKIELGGYLFASTDKIISPNIFLTLTPNHKLILSNYHTIYTNNLEIKDRLFKFSENSINYIEVISKKEIEIETELYNLTTDKGNYFLNDILIENK